jgi:hypothetical protein
MSTAKKIGLWILGALAALAGIVSAIARGRAAAADKKIRTMEVADAKHAAEQQARLQQLADIKRQLETLPTTSPKRTQAQVDAELKRRGLLK